eukprot:6210071-Pleurochrysis_carterae.AAC.2
MEAAGNAWFLDHDSWQLVYTPSICQQLTVSAGLSKHAVISNGKSSTELTARWVQWAHQDS